MNTAETRLTLRHVVLWLAALILALMGQRQFETGGIIRDALLLYGAAAVLFVLAVRGVPLQLPARAQPAAVPLPARWRLAVWCGGAVLASAGMLRFYSRTAENLGLGLWLAGVIVMAISPVGKLPRLSRDFFQRHRQELIVFALLMLAAAGMRFYHLGQFPPAAYLDEADNGLEALKLLDSSVYIPYTRASNGHPTLFLYLLGLGFRLFGEGVLAMRLVTACIGLATVAAFYFLVREWFGMRPAQWAAFALAVSRWHVNFSRVVFEAVLTPFFAVLTMWFLARALRTGRWRDYAWAGLALGLGLQGYLGYRVFPVIVTLYLLLHILAWPGLLRRIWAGVLALTVAAIIGFGPLAVYFVRFPEDFTHRATQASVMQDIEREGSYQPLKDNIRKTALMFVYQGDPRPRHNLPNAPMLDRWSAIFFMLGLGYALYRWRDPDHLILWLWLPIGALPGVLSLADSNPHSLRTIINLPAVFLAVAAFWNPTIALFRRVFQPWGSRGVLAASVLLLAFSGWLNADAYFRKQAGDRAVYYDFDPDQNLAAQFALEHGRTHRLLISPALTNHSAIKFIDYRIPYEDFLVNRHLPIREAVTQPVMFILEPAHQSIVQRLQELYPGGRLGTHTDRYGQVAFYSYALTPEDITGIQGLPAAYYAGPEIGGTPAFTRRDPTLDLEWETPPLSLPFSAEWRGSLFVPAYGDYGLSLECRGGRAVLVLGEEEILTAEGERRETARRLPAGFYPIRVSAQFAALPAGLHLRWTPPGGTEEAVPQVYLYDEGLSRFGLLGRYFHGADQFGGQPALIQIDPYIAPNDPLPAPFSIEWVGKIYIPRAGVYAFGTNSDDGSYLFIDGQMIVDNGGHHGDVYREGMIQLSEGFHDIILRYFQVDGGRKIELWWTPPGGAHELVPAHYLRPPGVSLEELPALPSAPAIPAAGPVPPVAGVDLVASWGSEGDAPGQFRTPRGVAMDAQGRVYVADAGNGRVQVFSAQGDFIAAWTTAAEPLQEPFDVAVAPDGRVYVLDVARQVIARFSPEGAFEKEFGADLAMYGPRGLGVDLAGNIYVADTGGSRILKLSPEGELLAVLAGFGAGPGQVNQPTDAAVDSLGRIYIADVLNMRLQVLDSAGGYLGEWPISGANTTDSPHLAVDAAGRLFLTDPEAHIVLVYDGQGNRLGQWGGEGTGPGQFRKAVGVAAGPDGLIAVTDVYNHRVQTFQVR